jgi:hypothetical protein
VWRDRYSQLGLFVPIIDQGHFVKKLLLESIVLAALIAGPATAADLAVKRRVTRLL